VLQRPSAWLTWANGDAGPSLSACSPPGAEVVDGDPHAELGHFPTEQAAMKCLYLVTRSLDPTGAGRTRWTIRWKPVINAFAVTFGDRWPAAELY
jgi:hypothetical protein